MYLDQVCVGRLSDLEWTGLQMAVPLHCRREGKNRVLIFLTAPRPQIFPGAKVPTFNSINFREKGEKNYSGINGKWWGTGNDGFIFTPE